MKRFFILNLLVFLSFYVNAQLVTPEALDSIKNEFTKSTNAMVQEYNQYAQKAREEYERYEAQARADYMNYVKKVQTVWGTDTMVDNTKYTWVEYGNNLTDRSIVNFETGDIDVEVVMDEHATEAETDTALVDAITRLLESRGSTCPYPSSVDVSKPITKEPILDGLVDLSAYDLSSVQVTEEQKKVESKRKAPALPTNAQNLDLSQPVKKTQKTQVKETHPTTKGSSVGSGIYIRKRKTVATKKVEEQKKAREVLQQRKTQEVKRKLAQIVLKQTPKKVQPMAPSTPKEQKAPKKIVKVSMKLVATNLSRNAVLYKDIVTLNSRKFNIEEPLIYAVMEQESSFNPEATSWVPAYGLMQLVPRSGGLEAYKYVYKKEWVPTRSYLFVPENNIELGTAYLRVLMNQFASVSNPECRRLCVIASYNTGAGNVSRAFTGYRRLGKKTLSLINQYDYDGLFTHLTTHLNTNEARNYVRGVTRRRAHYL